MPKDKYDHIHIVDQPKQKKLNRPLAVTLAVVILMALIALAILA
tara:strand:+ start:2173 stop:2304 length:132 start_codon:yes stop_codon:yes gene_type:complete